MWVICLVFWKTFSRLTKCYNCVIKIKVKEMKTKPYVVPGPGSLDFRAGELYSYSKKRDGFEKGVFVNSGESVLIRTVERVTLFSGAGLVLNKSSIARRGLAVATQLLEPMYDDYIWLSLTNVGRFPQKIYKGDKIVQLILLLPKVKLSSQKNPLTLSLGNEIAVFKSSSDLENFSIKKGYFLNPGEFVLGISQERVSLEMDGGVGVLTQTDNCFYHKIRVLEGIVNPGFNGKIVIEIKNMGSNPVRIEPGIEMYKMHFVPAKTFGQYSSFLGSKYVGDKTDTPQL